MKRYLIVAHQTADSPDLVEALQRIRRTQPDAEFGLVVPATPVKHLASWTRGESRSAAAEAGERARQKLAAAGIDLVEVTVGDANPLYAAADAFNRTTWDHVIISTLPVGVSRWLKMDAVSRLHRELAVPVTHVVADESHAPSER